MDIEYDCGYGRDFNNIECIERREIEQKEYVIIKGAENGELYDSYKMKSIWEKPLTTVDILKALGIDEIKYIRSHEEYLAEINASENIKKEE